MRVVHVECPILPSSLHKALDRSPPDLPVRISGAGADRRLSPHAGHLGGWEGLPKADMNHPMFSRKDG